MLGRNNLVMLNCCHFKLKIVQIHLANLQSKTSKMFRLILSLRNCYVKGWIRGLVCLPLFLCVSLLSSRWGLEDWLPPACSCLPLCDIQQSRLLAGTPPKLAGRSLERPFNALLASSFVGCFCRIIVFEQNYCVLQKVCGGRFRTEVRLGCPVHFTCT